MLCGLISTFNPLGAMSCAAKGRHVPTIAGSAQVDIVGYKYVHRIPAL